MTRRQVDKLVARLAPQARRSGIDPEAARAQRRPSRRPAGVVTPRAGGNVGCPFLRDRSAVSPTTVATERRRRAPARDPSAGRRSTLAGTLPCAVHHREGDRRGAPMPAGPAAPRDSGRRSRRDRRSGAPAAAAGGRKEGVRRDVEAAAGPDHEARIPPRPRERRARGLERDGGQCAFVAKNGRRCTERSYIEFHHANEPYALGGEATVENISLRCRAHNVYESELIFGPYDPSRVRETPRRMDSVGGYWSRDQ